MERIKALDRYPKVILLILLIMALVFIVPYSVTVSRVGFLYEDTILVPSQEDGNTVYSGQILRKQAVFTVSADKVVEFRHGDKHYGPYTAKEDISALPKENNIGMTGIEIRCGEKIIFRGGVMKMENYWWFVNEDGSSASINITISASNGVTYDEDGNIIDPMEPSVWDIWSLMEAPKLTHKGTWVVWFFGVFMCLVTTVSILFADELFRWKLSFRVRDAYDIEPSDWELISRNIAWTLIPIAILILFVKGLG